MKNIFKIVIAVMSLVLLGACSKNYLSTEPTSSTGSSTIFETVDNVELAINGLYKCMTQQYSAFGQGYNGEGTVKYYLGNFGGNNFNLSGSGNTASMNQSYHDNNNSTFILYPWYYYYRIIGNVNTIIANVDAAEGAQERKDYYKAQALVMRAYCYMMLSQLFHYRWSDGKSEEAKNGNGLVLRIEPSNTGMELSSAAATFKQIYADLDAAIPYLEKETVKRNALTENYQIDATVAYAIYARAALIRLDYTNALKYARLAYNKYPLMSVSDYNAGFYTPNSEWIWSSYGGAQETLYYYSYFAYVAYNANTSTVRTYPRCISKELYEKIEPTDIRKKLFLDPENMAYSTTTGKATKDSPLYKKAFAERPDLTKTAQVAAYMQFKVKCADNLGVGNLNHFRSSEMYLIEAEACYFLNDPEGAQKALIALTKTTGRDPSYTCTKTGTDLLNEIKFYRSVELWGEGFEFFDLKRWGDQIERKGFKDGGNWYSSYAVTVKPDAYNSWTNVLPKRETDYNDAL